MPLRPARVGRVGVIGARVEKPRWSLWLSHLPLPVAKTAEERRLSHWVGEFAGESSLTSNPGRLEVAGFDIFCLRQLVSAGLRTDKAGETEQEAWSAGLGPVRAGDDPAVRFVADGLVEASVARRPCVGGLVDAAAGERRSSRRDRADARRPLFERVDVEAQLRARLPEQAQGAAPRWRRRSRARSARAADRLLQTPRVQTLWQNINKRAHAGVVKVLEGKDLGRNGNISTANGDVTLDLRPLITSWRRGSGWKTS